MRNENDRVNRRSYYLSFLGNTINLFLTPLLVQLLQVEISVVFDLLPSKEQSRVFNDRVPGSSFPLLSTHQHSLVK